MPSVRKSPKPFHEAFIAFIHHRKFARDQDSFKQGMRSAVLGQSDFSAGELIRSSYDLKEASKKYKFALVPKVSSIYLFFVREKYIILDSEYCLT